MFTTASTHSGRPAAAFDFSTIDLEGIARETGFIKYRTLGFSAEGFLLTLLKAVAGDCSSLRGMCNSLALSQKRSLSKQALHEKFNEEGLEFVRQVLVKITEREMAACAARSSGSFGRILVEDATQLRLHPGNSDHFKGLRNQSGWTSTVKLDVLVDLISDCLFPTLLSEGKEQDKNNGERLFEYLEANDLVLRDRGYWNVTWFARIAAAGAWWISRLPGNCQVWDLEGKPLEEHLQQAVGDWVELECEITAGRHRARLVARRLTPEQANLKRAKAKKHRQKQGNQPKKAALIREDWAIVVTNLEVEQMSREALLETYAQRWAIEIRFRAIKQSTRLRELLGRRHKNKTALSILLTAAMIYAHLSAAAMSFHRRQASKGSYLSLEKVASWLSSKLLNISRLGESMDFDIRHLCAERRSRRSQREQLLMAKI